MTRSIQRPLDRFVCRRNFLQAGLALSASLLVPAARACEFFTATLRITHPWTRATAAGDPFAVVCLTFDEVSKTDRLIGVESPVAAGAEMGGDQTGGPVDVLIPAGRETVLSEEGVHVRLVGLRHPLELARTYPLTLIFDKGGAVGTKLSVDYARSA
jgi:copper(I)-binding protein